MSGVFNSKHLSKNGHSFPMIGAIGQNFKSIHNSFFVTKASTILYFCGNCLIEKNTLTHEHKYYFKEGLFTAVSKIDVAYDKEEDAYYITIAEYRPESTILTIINLSKNTWYELNTRENLRIVCMRTNPKIRYIYMVVTNEKQDEYYLLAWKFDKEKKIGRLPLKHRFDKIELHPLRPKTVLLFSKTEIKLYELRQQIKLFQEKFHYLPIQGEQDVNYLDFCFYVKKKTFFLLVLTNKNTIYFFHEDFFLKKQILDLSIVSFTKFALNAANNFGDLLNIGVNNNDYDENDDEDEGSKITLTKMIALKKYVVIVSDNFYLAFCKFHKHIFREKNAISQNLFFIHRGYHLAINEKLEFEETLYNFSSNVTGTLLTLTSCVMPIKVTVRQHNASYRHDKVLSSYKLKVKNEIHLTQKNLYPTININPKNSQKNNTTSISKEFDFNFYILNLNNVDTHCSPLKEFFSTGTHSSIIHNIKISRSKDLFVTIGDDCGRIWDHSSSSNDKPNKALYWTTPEEKILDLDIHPFGLFVAIGTILSLKIYAILANKISLTKEINNIYCKRVCYSSRAKYLVANERNFIHAFETIHYTKIYTFSAHSAVIRDILISESQYWVISYCENRQIMMWQITDKEVLSDPLEKELKPATVVYKHDSEENYSSYVYDEKNDLLICGGTQVFIRIYKDYCRVLALKIIEPMTSCSSLALNLLNSDLYIGTHNGSIRTYSTKIYLDYIKHVDKSKSLDQKSLMTAIKNFAVPNDLKQPSRASLSILPADNRHRHMPSVSNLNPNKLQKILMGDPLEKSRSNILNRRTMNNLDIEEKAQQTVMISEENSVYSISSTEFTNFKISNSKIDNMVFIKSSAHLIFSEEQGNLFILNLQTIEHQTNSHLSNSSSEINLISKYKVLEENRKIKQLTAEVERLKNVKMIEEEKMSTQLTIKLKSIEEKFQMALHENTKIKNNFEKRSTQNYERLMEKVQTTQITNKQKLAELTSNTNSIIEYEIIKTEELRERNKLMQAHKQEDLERVKAQHQKNLDKVNRQLNSDLSALEKEYSTLINRIRDYNSKFITKITLEEEDHENEIELYNESLKNEIEIEKRGGSQYRTENENLILKNNKEIEQIYSQQKNVDELILKNTQLMEEKAKYTLTILKLQEKLLEREQIIIRKECDMKMAVDIQKSLENFKFIMDRRIEKFISEKNKLMGKINEKECAIKQLFVELINHSELNVNLTRTSALQNSIFGILNMQNKKKMMQIDFMIKKFDTLSDKIIALMTSKLELSVKRTALKKVLADFFQFDYANQNLMDDAYEPDKENKPNPYSDYINENFRIKEDIESMLNKIQISTGASHKQVLTEVAKTKNLIEECNRLEQENDYYNKILMELHTNIETANHIRGQHKRILTEERESIRLIINNNSEDGKSYELQDIQETLMNFN